MSAHLGLHGIGCFGGDGWKGGMLYILLLVIVIAPLMFCMRHPQFYWLSRVRDKTDPYDLAAIYQEYQLRAEIGRELASKDTDVLPRWDSNRSGPCGLCRAGLTGVVRIPVRTG